jgi:hypothetical protein
MVPSISKLDHGGTPFSTLAQTMKVKVGHFDFDLDPYHFVWWLLTTTFSYMPTMMTRRRKTKNVGIFGENSVLTLWRHKIEIDLESTHQGFSYEILHDMVPYDTVNLKI